MNIPVNLFMWIMAFLPIAALLILMWLGSDRGGTGRITDNGSYWSCFL